MIRPLTIVTFLMACGSGLYLYQSKHEAQVLDRTIEKTVRETAAYREQSRLLAAEWTMLNDPEMLRRFADSYLALKTISPSQFTGLADLDSRLPPVQLPAPADSMDEADAPAAVPIVSNETVPAVIVPDPDRMSPRPPAPPVASAPRPAEGKIAAPPALAAAEPAYRPTGGDVPYRVTGAAPIYRSIGTDAAAKPSTPGTVQSPRVAAAEPRPSELRPNDLRAADRRTAQAGEPHAAEVHVAEVRAPAPPRPAIDPAATRQAAAAVAAPSPASITRINSNHPPAAVAPPVATGSAYGGSLLGMARGAAPPPPVPRPTPVNTTQLYNAN